MQKTSEPAKKPKLPPMGVIRAVNKLRTGVSTLQRKMVPPHVALLELVTGMWAAQATGVAASLGVADHIGEHGATAEELARKCQCKPGPLYRLLRALSTTGLFHEHNDGRFTLTAIGACLRADHPNSMRQMAIFQTRYNWEHWAELEHCVRTGTNAVEKVRGEPPFEHLAKHPEKAACFDGAMVNITKMGIVSVLAAYDFSKFATIADVGGGYGPLLAAILEKHPDQKGILYELPHVAREAKKKLEHSPAAGRITIEPGSFFEGAPEGADAYVMKHILHDWSDKESVKIMKQIRKRIPAHGKLLLIEAVVAGRNEPHFSKFLDLEMLVVTTGKERTREEWEELVEEAGFRLARVVPTIGMSSVIECVPA